MFLNFSAQMDHIEIACNCRFCFCSSEVWTETLNYQVDPMWCPYLGLMVAFWVLKGAAARAVWHLEPWLGPGREWSRDRNWHAHKEAGIRWDFAITAPLQSGTSSCLCSLFFFSLDQMGNGFVNCPKGLRPWSPWHGGALYKIHIHLGHHSLRASSIPTEGVCILWQDGSENSRCGSPAPPSVCQLHNTCGHLKANSCTQHFGVAKRKPGLDYSVLFSSPLSTLRLSLVTLGCSLLQSPVAFRAQQLSPRIREEWGAGPQTSWMEHLRDQAAALSVNRGSSWRVSGNSYTKMLCLLLDLSPLSKALLKGLLWSFSGLRKEMEERWDHPSLHWVK